MDTLPNKALSVRQPWAWAIIFGGKDVENRSWQAVNHGLKFKGRVAIHAAKGMTREEYEDAARFMSSIGVDCPEARHLIRGAVIGSAEVIDVVKDHPSPWFFGPRGLVLSNATSCNPVGVSGALGYFNWRGRLSDKEVPMARWMVPQNERHEAQGSLI